MAQKFVEDSDEKKFHEEAAALNFKKTEDELRFVLEEKRKEALNTPQERWADYRLGKLAAGGIIALLVSVVIETVSHHTLPEDSKWGYLTAFGTPYLYAGLFREIAFAFLIAGAIIFFVEGRHRKEANVSERAALLTLVNATQKNSELLNKKVFDEVLKRKIPENILDHQLNTVFSSRFTRRDLKLIYDIDEITALDFSAHDETRKLSKKAKAHLVKVTLVMSYKMKNVTDLDLVCPIKVHVPVTNVTDLKKYCRLESVMIGDVVARDEIEEANDRAADDDPSHCKYLFEHNLESNEEVSVRMQLTMVKEKSDADLWTSLYSSEDIEVSVDMNVDDLEWSIHSISHGVLKELTGLEGKIFTKGNRVFESNTPVLPFQGINLWWRRTEPAVVSSSRPVFKSTATNMKNRS